LLQTGSVRHAARAVGLSPSSAHRLRRRLAGTEFDRNWEEALLLYDQLTTRPLSIDLGAGVPRPRIGSGASGTHR